MGRLLRYTLNALRRGTQRRGDSVTVLEGSPFDQQHRDDPAWTRTVMHGAVNRQGPVPDPRAESAYQALMVFMTEQAARIRALSAEQHRAYQGLLHDTERALSEAFEVVFPPASDPEGGGEPAAEPEVAVGGAPSSTEGEAAPEADNDGPEPIGSDEPLSEPDIPDEPLAEPGPELSSGAEGEGHLARLLTLLEDVAEARDTTTTIEALVTQAREHGIAVPDHLPRRRVDVANRLLDIATEPPLAAPSAADLGDA